MFRIPPERPTPNFPPSWEVAPTDSLPVVRYDVKAGQRSLDMLRWGLIPYWPKDINVGFANINAKAEGIAHAPHQLDRQVVKELEFGRGIDDHQPVGLGHLRGDLYRPPDQKRGPTRWNAAARPFPPAKRSLCRGGQMLDDTAALHGCPAPSRTRL